MQAKVAFAGSLNASNAQMYGRPTINCGGVSKSGGISGCHIPAIPCGAVLRRKHTHVHCKYIYVYFVSYRHTVQQRAAAAAAAAAAPAAPAAPAHRKSGAEQEDLPRFLRALHIFLL